MRFRWRLAGAIAAVGIVAACSVGGGLDADFPATPPRTRATTTTQVPDYGNVVLVSVPGRTTLPPPTALPGPAVLGGVVRGPDGLVPGATVRVERFVEGGVVTTDVLSGLDGTWRLERVPGGRYRVRAWRAPDLAGKPTVVFVEAARPATIDLELERRDGLVVTPALAPSPPVVDEPANLAVVVAQRYVDEAGIVRAAPLAGAGVELLPLGRWTLRSAAATFTDEGGRAGWQVVCRADGDQGLAVAVGTEVVRLAVPACVEPPPPTTAPASSTTTTATTLRPRGRPAPPTSA